MDKSQCFELGYIERSHGLDGSVVAVFDVDDASLYTRIDAVFLERSQQLVPFLVKGVSKLNGNHLVIKLEGVNSDIEAQNLKGSTLFLPDTVLPKLKPGQFFYHELVGATVNDSQLGTLGTISEVYEFPHQILVGMQWQGAEVLIPVHDSILRKFDRAKNSVETTLPEGLLDVYLQNSESEPNEN